MHKKISFLHNHHPTDDDSPLPPHRELQVMVFCLFLTMRAVTQTRMAHQEAFSIPETTEPKTLSNQLTNLVQRFAVKIFLQLGPQNFEFVADFLWNLRCPWAFNKFPGKIQGFLFPDGKVS